MKERPIAFKQPHADEMVRSILDGRKTQHRVPMKPQPNPVGSWLTEGEKHATTSMIWCEVPDIERFAKKPKWHKATPPLGTVGDRLWVRETWAECIGVTNPHKDDTGNRYKATDSGYDVDRWTPSIHMPRWASRIDLEITRVWVERVQDITEEDALKEGCEDSFEHSEDCNNENCTLSGCPDDCVGFAVTAKTQFRDLWQSIYGTWEDNPFVWAYEFRRIKP